MAQKDYNYVFKLKNRSFLKMHYFWKYVDDYHNIYSFLGSEP